MILFANSNQPIPQFAIVNFIISLTRSMQLGVVSRESEEEDLHLRSPCLVLLLGLPGENARCLQQTIGPMGHPF